MKKVPDKREFFVCGSFTKGLSKILALLMVMMLAGNSYLTAQEKQPARQITGKVVSSDDNLPIPGANVVIMGTQTGTVTDMDGNFSIAASSDDVLQVSFIGYLKEEITVGNSTTLNVNLIPDIAQLDEVVVVGYGVQKKKLLTGATSHVKGEDLVKMNSLSPLAAMQGQSAGVRITPHSGQPGEGFKVSIRGIATVGSNAPLFIVDGMPVDSALSFLNNADIESVDILKDAASAAIYGNRAANGVVLITTKQGKAGQSSISYDGYVGVQNLYKKLELLNAKQYALIMNEANLNNGRSLWNFPSYGIYLDSIGTGTDWLDEMFVKNALTQSHVISATGGSEKSVYSMSIAYTDQEGILGGKDISDYNRYSFRINSEHKSNKYFTIGEHFSYAYTQKRGVGVGDLYSNSLHGAFNTSPFLPVYDNNGEYFNANAKDTAGQTLYKWNNGETNPYGILQLNNQRIDINNYLIGDIYAVIEPLLGLKYRTNFGINLTAGSYNKFAPQYELSSVAFNPKAFVEQSSWGNVTWKWENTISYDLQFSEHSLSALAGMSAQKRTGATQYGKNTGLIFNDYEHAWLDNAKNLDYGGVRLLTGKPETKLALVSYFGRVLYDFRETFLLSGTLRIDGSSRFAVGNRWGYFPSFSAGWVLSNQDFLKSLTFLDFLKLRASWGQNGNEKIREFAYLATILSDQYYFFGNDVATLGSYPNVLPNEELTWETSEQLNIGFDARVLNRLSINLDYYIKTTKDWLVEAPIMATAGANAPLINGGDVRNSGLELVLGWNDRIGNINYYVNGNVSYNKNKVLRIANAEGIIHGKSNVLWQGISEIYRAEVGYPIGYFWGYETAGLFQDVEQINNYRNDAGQLLQKDAKPGDVIFVDHNNDGIINEDDRHEIGNPHPDFIFGLNFGAEYKGFDFSITSNGVFGNQIAKGFRSMERLQNNWTTEVLERWHGKGTSNRFPRVIEKSADKNKNWDNFSDLYLESGAYWRFSNVTLGYDFATMLRDRIKASQVRVYLAAQNLFTITKYTGMDPDIGYAQDGWASGIDLGYYPHPRTFLIGINLKF
ncbi:MAG: TonB-dependent receptor [Bacteroidales bacterium]|nr:TonB-dependent receptor [Bacteroidales bacterium]